jgi:hypothetical protein
VKLNRNAILVTARLLDFSNQSQVQHRRTEFPDDPTFFQGQRDIDYRFVQDDIGRPLSLRPDFSSIAI